MRVAEKYNFFRKLFIQRREKSRAIAISAEQKILRRAADRRIRIETAFFQYFIKAFRIGPVKKYVGDLSGHQKRSGSDARIFVL